MSRRSPAAAPATALSTALLGQFLVNDLSETRKSRTLTFGLRRSRIADGCPDLIQRLPLRHQLLDLGSLRRDIGRLLLDIGFAHHVAVSGNELIRVERCDPFGRRHPAF